MKRIISLFTLIFILFTGSAWGALSPEQFGAVGDGKADDSVAIQSMLTSCSSTNNTATIPDGKNYLIKSTLYIWNRCNLIGSGGRLILNAKNKYLICTGISGVNRMEEPFAGTVSGVKFQVVGGTSGRVLFFFRTRDAHIENNEFDVGVFAYSATSSGNDVSVLAGSSNYIRQNITINGNRIIATADNIGSEGIGLADFDGVTVTNNTVIGVGDDPIGIHYSKNITITGNIMSSVDGRIFVSNPVNATISNNKHTRIPSLLNGQDYTGISLIYIGFENLSQTNNFSAPSSVIVSNNILIYGPTAIDQGAAIYVYGPRDVTISKNEIRNYSPTVIAQAKGIYILPAPFTATWTDPDGLDMTNTAKVRKFTVTGNAMTGKYPLSMITTGNCSDYIGPGIIGDNLAAAYNLRCPTQVSASNNSDWSSLPALAPKWTVQKRVVPGGGPGEILYDVIAKVGGV